MPWVRLHATRAYTDMAAALEKNERARVVANWTPSLLLQLEAYASGAATDKDEEIARKPVDALAPAERAHVTKESFSIDWEVWVKPVPRYAELLAKRGVDLRRVDPMRVQQDFSSQDLLDLQVHFILGWMGFAARSEEPLVREMLAKQRGFTQEEKIALLDFSRRTAQRLLPRWKALAGRGLVEITCSPLYHPILPLLVDSESARRAMPAAVLPPRFRYPQDAREQVRRALSRVERDFGARPAGMWPSEGSVSPEVLAIFGEEGVRWCATDQGNLERSVVATPAEPPLHRAPWMCGPVALFFRDRELSDLIGFRYAKSEPTAAAQDLLRRIASAGRDATITLALDGENPWEHYPRSGELFLDALYSGLGGEVTPVLPRDEIAARPPRGRIDKLHSGSWIDSNFRIWIGHPEDNQAWSLLGEARAALESSNAPAEAREKAYQACLAAEGSDWFWWYGDDFTTENAPEFDALFRRNVEQVFRHLGLNPPERLAQPIISPHKDPAQASAVTIPPRRLIHPLIDGYAHGYFEWSGAGLHRPGVAVGGSMYQGGGSFLQVCFGFSEKELFLRLDPVKGTVVSGELRIVVSKEGQQRSFRMELRRDEECPVRDDKGDPAGSGRCGSIVELSIPLSALGVSKGEKIGLLVRHLRGEAEVDRLPRYGELEMIAADESFERADWHV